MGSPIESTEYVLAQQRLSDFRSNLDFKDYDVYFISGILEGLNERRRFIGNAGAVTRCSFTKAAFLDFTSFDLSWEIDLVNDLFRPSIIGDDQSFVGSAHDAIATSGVLLSMRLLNLFRYYVVETSMGALGTSYSDMFIPSGTFELGRHLLPPNIDNRYFAQMYRTYNTNTDRHYPCSNSNANSPALLSNPKINTRTNVVDPSANPLVRQDPKQPEHKDFYNEPTDLDSFSASGYPGNGDLGIVRAIGQTLNPKTNWPVFEYKGKLNEPKTISDFSNDTWPPGETSNSWALWTNKTELFKFEDDFYKDKQLPTDFFLRNEYLSSVFPVTQQPSGHAYKAIREHFEELISAIEQMKYFAVRVPHRAVTEGENPLTIDIWFQEAAKSSDYGGCLYDAGTCCSAGCEHPFFCTFGSGPGCCLQGVSAFPATIYPQLQCGDCGAYKCAPNGCEAPAVIRSETRDSLYSNPFPSEPDPIYYTKTTQAKRDTQGSTFGGGCPINTLADDTSEIMRPKRIVFTYAFTGTLTQPYRVDKFTTDTCAGFAVADGCVAFIDSVTEYHNVTYSFPNDAAVNSLGGAGVPDYTPNQAVAPFDNCGHQCLPTSLGGGGETKDYRQYAGEIAVATPTFTMIP